MFFLWIIHKLIRQGSCNITLCLLKNHSAIIFICLITSEPSSFLKNFPVIPISKATKKSFMERPPSPERPRYVSTKLQWQEIRWQKILSSHHHVCLSRSQVYPCGPSPETQVIIFIYGNTYKVYTKAFCCDCYSSYASYRRDQEVNLNVLCWWQSRYLAKREEVSVIIALFMCNLLSFVNQIC